ncbi:sulfotransferase family 2 domain-containing protein [Leisingera sp. ANG-M1]|uniref:sulfotransferase family 2 domain-containing protein n=1 Tax=Leisingera sp. ANG-M1 TaxID=1577895 RepID=UPI0006915A35|nr:sulfotransferase family 2 domain-containing protein [Leisingera sp. ANG-M1]
MGFSPPETAAPLPAVNGWEALPFSFIHIPKCGGTSVSSALGLQRNVHHTAAARRQLIGRDRWQALPSFSIVRNPFARVTSLYRYRAARNHPSLLGGRMGLNEWVRRGIWERDPAVCTQLYSFLPCAAWLLDEQARIMVDLVIKLETIRQDWCKVEELVGMQIPCGHENATRKDTATVEAALDQESVEMIRERFRADFVLFGYDPDNVQSAAPAAKA